MTGPLFHSSVDAAFLPAARSVYADLKACKLTHRYVLHKCSSQAFALNLFAPLTDLGRRDVLAAVGLAAVTAEEATFEYRDPADRLAETWPAGPHKTQVDVVLRGADADGNRLCALIEVKFTELDFSGCSAYANPANPSRSTCHTRGLFGGDPDRCFQLASHGNGRRRYDTYLADVPLNLPAGSTDSGGCLVRHGLNQPMRNLALAHLLLAEGEVDRVVYALCAPARHRTIWRRFAEVKAAFPDTAERALAALTAEQVAGMHPDHGADWAVQYPTEEIGSPA